MSSDQPAEADRQRTAVPAEAEPAEDADPAGSAGPAREPDPVEVLAADVVRVAGVADLHGGLFGEVGTYLPGRRVTGIRLADEQVDVHLVVDFGADVHAVVSAVRDVVTTHMPGRVDVYIEDVAPLLG